LKVGHKVEGKERKIPQREKENGREQVYSQGANK
jgi:hypothetical protein